MAAFSKEDLALLAQTIASALSRSGSSRYNPVSNETHKVDESPAARADAIRLFKNSQDHKKVLQDLTKMQADSNRSIEALDRAVEYNSKMLGRTINEYDDYNDSQKELVKVWRAFLSKTNSPEGEALKKLVGKIDTLEDVLRASDTAKITTELYKSLQSLEQGNNTIESYLHQMNAIAQQLDENGKTLNELDPDIAELHKQIAHLAEQLGAVVNHKTGAIDSSNLDDESKGFLAKYTTAVLKTAQGQSAIHSSHGIAIQSATAAATNHAKALDNMTGFVQTATKGISKWSSNVTSASFAIEQLAKAAVYMYGQMMTAANTGTQRSITEVMGNTGKAIANGIDPKVLQEIQAKNTSARVTYGKENFDNSITASTDFLSVTGDRGEASKIKAEMLSMMQGFGVETKDAAKSSGTLAKSMGHLQYLTGMTGEQIAQMTSEMANDKTFREGMIGLNSKERANALANLNLMLEENRIRGLTIDQSKQIFKSQQDMEHGNRYVDRIKGSYQLKALGGMIGMDTGFISQVYAMKGGINAYVKQNAKSPEEEQAMRARFQTEDLEAKARITKLAGDNSNASGQAMIDAAERLMTQAGPMFTTPVDEQTLKANAIIGDAAKEYKEGAEISLGAAKLMMLANNASTLMNGPAGALFEGIAGTMIGVLMTKIPVGKIISKVISPAAPTIANATGAAASGGGSILSKITQVFSKTAGFATTASTVASDIKNGASTVLNGAKNIGSAPVVRATTQIFGDIKSGAGIAIDAAAKATKSVPSSVMSGLSSSMGWIAKKAPIITAALAAIDVGTIVTDDKLDRHQKVEGASKSIGISAGAAGGAWAGAATGAAIGSVVPILGTGVGGVIGGVIGGIAGGWGGGKVGGMAGEAVGKGVNATIDYVSPTQPSVDGQSVKPNSDITKSTTATDNSVISNQSNTTQIGNVAVAPDDKSVLNKSVNDMLQILTNIFNLLQAQAEELNGSSEKQIALQERLHRALKNSGIGYSEAPASQSYN